MKVLDFEVDLSQIEQGKLELADIVKTSIWQQEPQWFDKLDFENDAIFTEPSLFYYFRNLKNKINYSMSLDQILYGYLSKELRNPSLSVFTDAGGIVYLPNLGFVTTPYNGETEKNITFSEDAQHVFIDGLRFKVNAIPSLKSNPFFLMPYQSTIYAEKKVVFLENINTSILQSETPLDIALNYIKTQIPDFYAAIALTTREFALFNSDNFPSFTALHHFGTAFLNVSGKQPNAAFFLEDVAHQSGHIMYYALTHDATRFFKPNQQVLLKTFSTHSHDTRSIYGAFHGLFTYTTILHCLDTALKENGFHGAMATEILARLGFYYEKFELDLITQGDDRILTKEGWRYYEMFYTGFLKIKKSYYHIIKYFDYSNQPYIFDFQKFKEVNSFSMI
jgi:hypothetical protein